MRCDAEMRTADARREEIDYCQKGGRNATTVSSSSSSSGVAALVASTSRCRFRWLERLKRHRAMQARRLVASGWVQCREVQQVKQVRSPTPLTGNAQSPPNRPSPCRLVTLYRGRFYARDALVLQTKNSRWPAARRSPVRVLVTVSTLLLVNLLV